MPCYFVVFDAICALQQDLSCNDIEIMAPVGRLTSLERLCLDGNQISTLEGMQRLTRLQRLSVQRNKLEDAKQLLLGGTLWFSCC